MPRVFIALTGALVVLAGCSETAVWISDPYYDSLLLHDRSGEPTPLLRELESVAASHELRLSVRVLSEEESYPDQIASIVNITTPAFFLFSPLLGQDAASLSTRAEVPIGVMGTEPLDFSRGEAWSVSVSFEPAFREAGSRAARYVAATPPGTEKRLGVLFVATSERDRANLSAFLDGAEDILNESRIERVVIESSVTRETLRSRLSPLRQRSIETVAIFAGGDTGYAAEQIGGDVPVVVRDAERFGAFRERLLFSIEYDMGAALDRLLTTLLAAEREGGAAVRDGGPESREVQVEAHLSE